MDGRPGGLALIEVAQAYVDRWLPGARSMAALARAEPRWDEEYCRRVADYFDRAPLLAFDDRLACRYERFKCENLRLYQAILDAGIVVRPWRGGGQPYGSSAELRAGVRSTGVLYVFLTSAGHGPGETVAGHPMLAPSGVVADGIPLCHNDIFRAVHDIFGHVMPANSFSARGELKASFCHMGMYSEPVHPVLFTEQIAQICWFFFGPHADARYPEQKVFEFPRPYIDTFKSLFLTGTEEPR